MDLIFIICTFVRMNIFIDANIIISVMINEPEKDKVVKLTKGGLLLSSSVLPYEVGNALTRMKKKRIMNDKNIFDAWNIFQTIPIRLINPDIENALQISCKYSTYAYDAYYLETASRLNTPLLTFDEEMKRIGKDLKLKILE